jgi:hypothetical protein
MILSLVLLIIFAAVVSLTIRRNGTFAQTRSDIIQSMQAWQSSGSLPRDFSWQEVDHHAYASVTGTSLVSGNYASPPIDQHRASWCGCCYLVATLQSIQDRIHVLIGKQISQNNIMYPWVRLDAQQTLSDYQRYKGPHTPQWNACQGGVPLSVMNAIKNGKCQLVFEHMTWTGFPGDAGTTVESDLKVKVADATRIVPTNRVKERILDAGSVVLGINAMLLKHVDEHGIVKDYHDSLISNHAVSVTGWTVRNGIECWIVRNSWGKERVPASMPDDLSCVTTDGNRCQVSWEAWKGDPINPGFVLVPTSHPPLNDDANSPWFEAVVEFQSQ